MSVVKSTYQGMSTCTVPGKLLNCRCCSVDTLAFGYWVINAINKEVCPFVPFSFVTLIFIELNGMLLEFQRFCVAFGTNGGLDLTRTVVPPQQ